MNLLDFRIDMVSVHMNKTHAANVSVWDGTMCVASKHYEMSDYKHLMREVLAFIAYWSKLYDDAPKLIDYAHDTETPTQLPLDALISR